MANLTNCMQSCLKLNLSQCLLLVSTSSMITFQMEISICQGCSILSFYVINNIYCVYLILFCFLLLPVFLCHAILLKPGTSFRLLPFCSTSIFFSQYPFCSKPPLAMLSFATCPCCFSLFLGDLHLLNNVFVVLLNWHNSNVTITEHFDV